MLIISASLANSEAGILSILKYGRPDGQGTPAATETQSVNEWQRVAFVGSAKVKQVTGHVEILNGVDRWSVLPRGKMLQPGDIIRTHEESRAIIQMTSSGSLVSLTPKTMMRLTEYEKGWDKSVLSGAEESKGYTVRAVRGEAEFKTNKKWQSVTVNTVLPAGATVRTQSDTTIDLFHVGTGSFLRMNPKCELVLDPTAQYSSRQVAVQSKAKLTGRATAQVSR